MKSNYLNSLEREFYFVSDEEREQIIGEYTVHFDERIKDGATEQEVINNLGSPKTVAIEYASELDIKYSALEKHISNFKRDSNIYISSLKRKMNDIKREEALKRQNLKKYSTGDNNGQSIPSSDFEHSNTTNSHLSRLLNIPYKLASRLGSMFIRIFFLCKIIITYCWRILINFLYVILGISFALNALVIIVIGLLLPLFLTFNTYAILIWLLIYGCILSAVVFFGTISIVCLKRFGRFSNEQTT